MTTTAFSAASHRIGVRARCRALRPALLCIVTAIGLTATIAEAQPATGLRSLFTGPTRTPEQCSGLVGLKLEDTVITAARIVPAAKQVPEYCQVEGGIETVILFEVALPTRDWNGRFFFAGGGGYNGNIPSLEHAIARGYAVTATDTGHRGEHWDASALYDDPEAQLNYAHRGAHLVTEAAKRIVAAYYGEPARHSYFLGCSNGGKMGLIAAQRYPQDYDGIVIGGPVVDRTGLMIMFDWTQRALLGAEIPPYKIPAMSKATMAACDANDGLADGIIDRPNTCSFDPRSLICEGADSADCLTSAQAEAWRKILDGPVNSKGERLYVGYTPGHEEDYPAYVTGLGVLHGYPSSNFMYMDNFLRWFVFGPSYDPVLEFDFDRDPPKLDSFVADQDATDPDLRDFAARGGKLLIYNGWADHSTPPQRIIDYYEAVQEVHGEETADFARLFMVPGYHHCSGGPGPNHFGAANHALANLHDPERDLMGAIVQWVEQDRAPERIVGTRYADNDPTQGVVMTRPFCPYPQVAQYTGTGSTSDAASFVCVPER